jgi:hypothetical protein
MRRWLRLLVNRVRHGLWTDCRHLRTYESEAQYALRPGESTSPFPPEIWRVCRDCQAVLSIKKRRETMDDEMRQSTRGLLAGIGGLVLLGGTALGVLFFSLLGLFAYADGHYAYVLVSLAAIGGLVYGLYSFLHPPAPGPLDGCRR